jgi:hypothetical protein
MQASTYAIDAMVDNLFRVSQLNRDEFHRKAKLGVKSTFDAYVQPYTVTDAERSLSTGLRNIMSTPCELGGALPPLNIGLNSRVSVVLSKTFIVRYLTNCIQISFSLPYTWKYLRKLYNTSLQLYLWWILVRQSRQKQRSLGGHNGSSSLRKVLYQKLLQFMQKDMTAMQINQRRNGRASVWGKAMVRRRLAGRLLLRLKLPTRRLTGGPSQPIFILWLLRSSKSSGRWSLTVTRLPMPSLPASQTSTPKTSS